MVLLDTNIVSELMKDSVNERVEAWLDSIPSQNVYTSAITKAEIEYGISILPDGKRKNQLKELCSQIFDLFEERILPFNKDSAQFFAEIRSKRKSIGRPINFADTQIAAIAVQHDLQLATRNVEDFQAINTLKLINPWEN